MPADVPAGIAVAVAEQRVASEAHGQKPAARLRVVW